MCSPARAHPEVSSSGSLSDSEMNSLPTATTAQPADDTEVLSRRLAERGEVTLETPQGGIPDVGHAGFEIPVDHVDESHSRSGSQPNTVPEPSMVPNSGGQPLVREGEPSASRTSVAPVVPDWVLEALRGASMDEEHHTLMSTVIRKVSSAKSGLTEACTSLFTGFEVSNKYV